MIWLQRSIYRTRNVSYVINNHFGQRFTDYINNYRVEYIKNRIAMGDLKRLTLESLATDSGFISRSNFYAAFKKVTSVSPTEYVRSLKETGEKVSDA